MSINLITKEIIGGTASIIIGWLVVLLRRASARMDQLKDEKASKDELRELKHDLRHENLELKKEIYDLRKRIEEFYLRK